MKYKLIGMLLVGYLKVGVAFVQPGMDAALREQYNHYVAGDHPLTIAELTQSARASFAIAAAGVPTYTYVRCYYKVNAADRYNLDPRSDYVWARQNDSYYKLNGYWFKDGMLQFKNMFFTAVSLAALQDICNSSVQLATKNVQQQSFFQVAADNQLSYNQTIWQNDNDDTNRLKINKLIAFGDSLSDINNMYNASNWKLPNNTSWFQGRFSNGASWPEYLARSLNVPVYNWAIGGAAGSTHLVVPGLVEEVQSWSNYMDPANVAARNYQPSKTLFTILIGANDFINYDRTVDQTISDLHTALELLIQKGATQIIVFNLPELTLIPVYSLKSAAEIDLVHAKVTDFNNRLPPLLQEINGKYAQLNLRLFDSKHSFDDLLQNKTKYGITVINQSCLDINEDKSTNYLEQHKLRSICTDANQFAFWDLMHITTRSHQILAKEVYDFVSANY